MRRDIVFALGGALETSFFPYRLARFKNEYSVRSFVALSPKAERFVSLLALSAISENQIYTEFNDFDEAYFKPKHIIYSKLDGLVVGSCTPRIICDAAVGRISCPVTRLLVYFEPSKVILAPKLHPSINISIYSDSIDKIKKRGIHVIESNSLDSNWMDVESVMVDKFKISKLQY